MVDRIKGLVNGEHSLKSATVLLTITLFLSNVLGLLRDILLSNRAQSLSQLDPYFTAFRIPDLIFNLLVLGAIASAFIPIYTDLLKNKSQSDATNMANTVLGTLTFFVTIALVILFFLMPIIIPLLTPLSAVNTMARQTETINLARIMLLSPFFFCLSYTVSAVLNAHRRFFTYSVAPLVYNLSIIVGALLLPKYGINAVAWAVVVGAALHFGVQLPSLIGVGIRLNPKVNMFDKNVGKVVMLMIPRTLSLGMMQIVLLSFTRIAATMSAGAWTIFNFANNFQTTPALIFGSSMATAVFPTLTDAVAEKDHDKYQHYYLRTLRVSLFVLIPATILVFLLRAQIMRLYIGLNHHTSWEDTIRAINTLSWFCISFVAQAVVFITARAFYALQDTKKPMYASVIGCLATVGAAVVLPQLSWFSNASGYDVASLALAYSFGMWVQAVLMIIWLPSQWRGDMTKVYRRILPISFIAIISGALSWLTLRIIGNGLNLNDIVPFGFEGFGTRTVLGIMIQAFGAAVVGLGSYALMAKWFNMEELGWLIRKKKLEE
ncbi:MAG: murein biosynthesis integral membrane protein MurJ [Patescibacteria group bacterium]|jgi:putative peptidoglycan lipid II flippase